MFLAFSSDQNTKGHKKTLSKTHQMTYQLSTSMPHHLPQWILFLHLEKKDEEQCNLIDGGNF